MCKTTDCHKEEMLVVNEIVDTLVMATNLEGHNAAFPRVIDALLRIREHYPDDAIIFYSVDFPIDLKDMGNTELIQAAAFFVTTNRAGLAMGCLNQWIKNTIFQAK